MNWKKILQKIGKNGVLQNLEPAAERVRKRLENNDDIKLYK